MDVGDANRTRGCSVAFPEFATGGRIYCAKVKGVAYRDQFLWVAPACSDKDIFDERRSGGCSIALPQFVTCDTIECAEIHIVANGS